MASLRKRGKVWYYQFIDGEGIKRERRGCSDKRGTEEMARAAESEAARIRAGLVDPALRKQVEAAKQPLKLHLEGFRRHLIDKGDTPKHVELFVSRASRMAALASGSTVDEVDPPKTATRIARQDAKVRLERLLNAARIGDLTRASVQAAMASLKEAGRSLATCNHHRAAICGFSRWAWKEGLLRDDPLVGVSGFNAKEDRRHDRRTIGVEDLRRLINVANEGKPYRLMSGPARALCYRLAIATGLRFSEIGSTTRSSFELEGESPSVTVAAAYTKNGHLCNLPLPLDLAADLRTWLAGHAQGQPTFHLPARGADMLKVDLGVAGIPYKDASGLVFDFHSLRCQTATLADQAGVSPRVVQRMMRHSTLALTDRYTRPRDVDLKGATSSLPSLKPEEPRQPSEPTRDTDEQPISDGLAVHLPHEGDASGRIVTDGVASTEAMHSGEEETKPEKMEGVVATRRDLTRPVANSGGGTRTPDTRIMIPLL